MQRDGDFCVARIHIYDMTLGAKKTDSVVSSFFEKHNSGNQYIFNSTLCKGQVFDVVCRGRAARRNDREEGPHGNHACGQTKVETH